MRQYVLDVEVWDKKGTWEQGNFLVRGYDDVLWTDSVDEVASYIKSDLLRLKKKMDDEDES